MTSNEQDAMTQREGVALRASVVICAFTMDRWTLLNEAVQSVVDQDLAPFEVILVIDHNHEMFEQCQTSLPALAEGSRPDTSRRIRLGMSGLSRLSTRSIGA